MLVNKHVISRLLKTLHQHAKIVKQLVLREILCPLSEQVSVSTLEQRILKLILKDEVEDESNV